MRLVLYSVRILRKYCILKSTYRCGSLQYSKLVLSAIFSSSEFVFRISSVSSSFLRGSAFRLQSLQGYLSRCILALFYFSNSNYFYGFFFRKIFSVSFNLSIVLRLLKCEITQLVEKFSIRSLMRK